MLKLMCIQIYLFLNRRKKWAKHKLKTFSQIYICFDKSIQKTNHSAKGSAEPLSVSEEHLADSHGTRASADTVPDFPEVDTDPGPPEERTLDSVVLNGRSKKKKKKKKKKKVQDVWYSTDLNSRLVFCCHCMLSNVSLRFVPTRHRIQRGDVHKQVRTRAQNAIYWGDKKLSLLLSPHWPWAAAF